MTHLRAGFHGRCRMVSTGKGAVLEATATRTVYRDLLVRLAPEGVDRTAVQT